MTPDEERPVVVERAVTPRGELVLRRAGPHFEVVSNGTFLMDTRAGRSERLLVRAALDATSSRAPRVLVGGLGVGFSVAEACADPTVVAVTVVEVEPVLVGWHATHLRPVSGATLADPRVEVVTAGLATWLAGTDAAFDAICLDVDNGPDWTIDPANDALYRPDGVRLLAEHLRPGGALTVWSSARSTDFERVLAGRFGAVRVVESAVERGPPDIVYLVRDPR
jgi:spermidine synthase